MFGPLLMILAIVAAIVLARWLVAPSQAHQPQVQTPLNILKTRFARGEIDKHDHEDRRRTLGD